MGQPGLSIEQLTSQLVDQASVTLNAQERLRRLLTANRSIVQELSLPAVLHRIVDTARDVAGARYAALGVIGTNGLLEQFLHVGLDEEAVNGQPWTAVGIYRERSPGSPSPPLAAISKTDYDERTISRESACIDRSLGCHVRRTTRPDMRSARMHMNRVRFPSAHGTRESAAHRSARASGSLTALVRPCRTMLQPVRVCWSSSSTSSATLVGCTNAERIPSGTVRK
jgi:hypothetical protein